MQRSILSAAMLAMQVGASQVEAANFQGLGELPGGDFPLDCLGLRVP